MIVAGPVIAIWQGTSRRCGRDELIALFASPTPDAGLVGRQVNYLAGFAERVAWPLRLAKRVATSPTRHDRPRISQGTPFTTMSDDVTPGKPPKYLNL
jgi:hypothetical protein